MCCSAGTPVAGRGSAVADPARVGRRDGSAGPAGTARGTGRSGAPHAMSVNETILALLCLEPDLALLAGEPPEAVGAARAAVSAPAGAAGVQPGRPPQSDRDHPADRGA